MSNHGGKREGAGRPPGVPNKLTRPVKELAAEQSEASINRLIQLRDGAESEQVRFAAAKELLDRAHGRPKQELNLTDNTVTIVLNKPGQPPVVVSGQQNALVALEHQPGGTQGSSILELNGDADRKGPLDA